MNTDRRGNGSGFDYPIISVVIPYSPVHTPEEMLEEAKQSAEKQSVDTEIIVVHDTQQRGPAWARNEGIERSDTRFVAFLDADDRWKDGKLEKQLEKLRRTGAGICLEGQEQSYESFVQGMMTGEIYSLTSSAVIDTDKVDARFEETLERREDHLFVLEAASEADVCFCEDLVEIRKHERGLSESTSPDLLLEQAEPFATLVDQRIDGSMEYMDAYWAHTHYTIGRLFHGEGDYTKAISQLVQSLRYTVQVKTVAALLLSSICLLRTLFPFHR